MGLEAALDDAVLVHGVDGADQLKGRSRARSGRRGAGS